MSLSIPKQERENTLLDAALWHAEQGYSVIPIQPRGKKPLIEWKQYQQQRATATEIERWWTRWPTASIGIVTGAISGIIVLDIDGKQGEQTLKEHKLHCPPTAISKTGGGGWHHIYKHPGFECRNFTDGAGTTILPNVDFRGDGGYIVAPPSTHASGNQYEWALDPREQPLADPPQWLLALIQKQSKGSKGRVQPEEWQQDIPQGQRNATLTRLAGNLLHNRHIPPGTVFSMLQAINNERCKPPLQASEVETIVKSIARLEAQKPAATQDPATSGSRGVRHTDLGNARRFVQLHGADVRYSHEAKKWFCWNGQRWEQDKTGLISLKAKDVPRDIYRQAANIQDEKERELLVKHGLRTESENRLRALITLAQSEPGIPISLSSFDANNFMLNCLNGSVDLRTGKLVKHDQKDYSTKLAPVRFDPDARSRVWETFLERILPDKEVRDFVQRFAGYSITGDVSEEKLAFAYGPPATGKSTFLRAIATALGDYSATADFEAFLARKNSGGPRNDIARLAGRRFVVSVEVEDGRRLAESLVNQLTGGDVVTARFLYQESFEFIPQFKIWLAANNRPRITGTDGAIWRRMVQIPFFEQIPKEERDPNLKNVLCDPEKTGPAILAWLVQGCLLWQKEGLNAPQAVLQTTEEYKQEMDPLAEFLADRCILAPQNMVSNTKLWKAYQTWCQENGERYPLGRKTFSQALMAKDLDQVHNGSRREWLGIGLLFDQE